LLRTVDARALALLMHKIKSSARMVGALHFAGLAKSFGINSTCFYGDSSFIDTSPFRNNPLTCFRGISYELVRDQSRLLNVPTQA
jgi:hypothetical protein